MVAIALIAVPKIFGVEFRAVVTGSMTPDIPVGSLVVIVPAKAEDIKVGDDISFVSAGDKVVTHRVIEIDFDNNEFITKGIANGPTAIDPPNKYENILGVVKLHIPKMGLVFSWIATTQGKIITATLIFAAYLLSSIVSLWSKGKKETAVVPIVKNEQELSGDEPLNQLMESFQKSDAMFEEVFGEKQKTIGSSAEESKNNL